MLDECLEDIVGSVRCDSDVAPRDAFQSLLTQVLAADGLWAGLVWLLDDQGRLSPLCESGMQSIAPDGRFVMDPQHQQKLTAALREGQVACVGAGEGDQPTHRPCTIAIGPLYQGAEPAGVLELFAEDGLADQQRQRLIGCLEKLCELGGELLAIDEAPQQETTSFLEQFDQFTLNLQRSLDVDEVASAAVHDGRVLLDCDRVSIALKRGNHAVIQAVSGQDKVNRRANLIRAMAALSQQAMAAGEVITYRGVLDGFAQQVQKPLSEYVVESRSRMVMLVPIRESRPLVPTEKESTEAGAPEPRRIIGCLIVEQATETQPRPIVTRRLDLVSDHVAAALTNARRHSSLFLLPVWRTLGRGLDWFRGRRRWIGAAIGIGLVLIMLGLVLIPWEYRVEADGKAMPVLQRDVFAPWDGDVVELFVESGDPVVQGQQLMRLESDDLDAEYIAARNEAREKRKQRDTLRGQLTTALAESTQDEQRRVEGELVKVRIELAAAEEKERLLAERIEKLTIRATIDGVVATYQLRQTLLDRPVRRGEMLLQVMDPTGPWQLELEVPDYRMGHVLDALRESDSHSLPVEYVAATAVERTFEGTLHLEDVATRSDTSEEEGTIVEAAARIDADDLPHRRIGADVTAKIECGETSLGYALFGDVVEFVQRHLWW